MKTIAEAREIIADLARQEGQLTFAREVLAGCWDDRSDVKSAMKDDFKPRKLVPQRPASYDSADSIR